MSSLNFVSSQPPQTRGIGSPVSSVTHIVDGWVFGMVPIAGALHLTNAQALDVDKE